MALVLKNPHSVLAALQSRPQDVFEVRLGPTRPSDAWDQVAELAAVARVPVTRSGTARPASRGKGPKSERVSAAEATVRERPDVDLDVLFAGAAGEGSPAGLWLALDCLQDPHNVGAIFRSAAFFGVRGLVTTRDRSAPLNATVYDVASGGLEHVPFSVQANLSRTLEAAKEAGLWVLGTSEHAPQPITAIPRDRSWLLVVGNEEHGLRRLTLETCDEVCRIAPRGTLGSLNASVAAGVMMAALTGAT